MGIRRGTTPEHTITLPFEVPAGAYLRIVYAQADEKSVDGERVLFEKTEKDCTVSGKTVSTKLTADETLRFDCGVHFYNGRLQTLPVFIQLGIETKEGEKAWSHIIVTTVERCLRKDGVIRNG